MRAGRLPYSTNIGDPPLPRLAPHPNANKVKVFLGFGAAFNQVTREKNFDGKMKGIFTTALLDALANAKTNRNGRLTGSLVRNHIHNVIDTISGSDSAKNLDIIVDDRKDVFFMERAPSAENSVSFTVADRFVNQTLSIVEFGGAEVLNHTITEKEFTLDLTPGFLKAQVASLAYEQLFEAPGNVIFQT